MFITTVGVTARRGSAEFPITTVRLFPLQCMFVVYMVIVAILLVNMLIAMMGNTYQKIAETRNEWQRQVTNTDESH